MRVFQLQSVEDIRQFMRAYQARERIGQTEYARRLGISQTHLSRFIGRDATYGITASFLQAIHRLHPQLRPSLHAAVFGADAVAQTDAGEQVPA